MIKDKKTILLMNKSDLESKVTEEEICNFINNPNIPIVRISAKEATGMEEFKSLIHSMFFRGEISFENEVYITNLRHKEALLSAR